MNKEEYRRQRSALKNFLFPYYYGMKSSDPVKEARRQEIIQAGHVALDRLNQEQ